MVIPRRRVALTVEQCWHAVPGGTATSLIESVRALQAHADLELVGVSARHAAPPAAPWVPPLPICQLPLPRRVLYESWHGLRRPVVQRATGPVDLIHVTGMAMPPRSAPLVVTIHDLAFLHAPQHFTRHGVRFFRRAIELAHRDADVVVCPSKTTRDDCLAYGFGADRLHVVPWGVEVRPVTAEAVDLVRSAYRLHRPYVLWTGTVEPRKNLTTLLRAFSSLDRDNVDLVLAGPDGWHADPAALAALGGSSGDRVRRLGFIPADDLRALYAGAAVFCFPSLREGFGLPVLEAMAQSTPVVTSVGTATAEVITDDPQEAAGSLPATAGVLVDPTDVTALAAGLRRLLEDPGWAQAVGEAGGARAKLFSWERTASSLVGAYEHAITSERRVGGPW